MSTLLNIDSTANSTVDASNLSVADSQNQQVEPAPQQAPTHLTIDEIQKLLPHRYPFLLVDRIIDYVPNERAIGIKNVSFNEFQFQGHFPGQPIMPGVLFIEALALVGGIVLTQMLDSETKGLFLFAGMDKVRFRRPVVPGDQIIMTVEVMYVKRRFSKMQARAEVNGKLAAEGELTFSILMN